MKRKENPPVPTELTVLAMAKGLASHAATRQSLVTQNVANSDTVGYRARDVKPFAEVYDGPGAPELGPAATRTTGQTEAAQVFQASATRPGHTGFATEQQRAEALQVYEISRLGADSPNGNSVSIEDQMSRGARAVADHELALGVLRKSMDLIRMSIGRR